MQGKYLTLPKKFHSGHYEKTALKLEIRLFPYELIFYEADNLSRAQTTCLRPKLNVCHCQQIPTFNDNYASRFQIEIVE